MTPEEMETAVFTDDKQTREENIRQITARLEEAFAATKSGWLFWVRLFTSIRRKPSAR